MADHSVVGDIVADISRVLRISSNSPHCALIPFCHILSEKQRELT
jgi:hypothetical protein